MRSGGSGASGSVPTGALTGPLGGHAQISNGDGEGEYAALVDFARHPDPSAHQLDQALGNRQPQP